MKSKISAKLAFLTVIVVLLFVAVIISGVSSCKKEAGNESNAANTSSGANITPAATAVASPTEVAISYMYATLGTIPDADVHYDTAKTYMSKEFRAEFKDDSFVPLSYCIQDGPSEVSVSSEKIEGDKARVQIKAVYGDEWMDMWDFAFVKEDGEWKLDEINCLQ